jgi:hypothetical protein
VTNPRPVVAVALAAATLVLVLAVIAAGGALRLGIAPWPGIAVIAMAAAAFVLSGKRRSYLVAGLLTATGLVSVGYGLVATEFLATVAFPGPILGAIAGLPTLGLGVAKAIAPP